MTAKGAKEKCEAAFAAPEAEPADEEEMLPERYRKDNMPVVPPPKTFWTVKRENRGLSILSVNFRSKRPLPRLANAHQKNMGISPTKGRVLERRVRPMIKTRFLLFFSAMRRIVESHTGSAWLNTQKSWVMWEEN